MYGMLYLLYVIIFGGLGFAVQKYSIKAHDEIALGFLFSLFGAIFYVPLLFMYHFSLPTDLMPWLLLISAHVLWFCSTVLHFVSMKTVDISLHTPIESTRSLFSFIFAIVLLKEVFTVYKMLGVILIVLGIAILTWKKGAFKHLRHPGVNIAIAGAIVVGFITIIDKYNMNFFDPIFYGFFVIFDTCNASFAHGK